MVKKNRAQRMKPKFGISNCLMKIVFGQPKLTNIKLPKVLETD